MFFLVNHDALHFGWSQCANHELSRIGRPVNDIDPLAGQFVGHRRHARTAHADTGADRVDTGVI
ncbi:hypothetical protein SDC9_210531 [bioreactor metagenome]|uniref:Uncharacterized protein n=1 Tax=bioreactor metagenome TaxID=1076179 RepID=A0A645JGE9_9ZZZZ